MCVTHLYKVWHPPYEPNPSDYDTKLAKGSTMQPGISIPLSNEYSLSIIPIENDVYELAIILPAGGISYIYFDDVVRFNKKHLHQVISRVYEWQRNPAILYSIIKD